MKRDGPGNQRISTWLSAGMALLLLSLSSCIVGAVLFGAAGALVIKEGFITEDTYSGRIRTTPGKAFDGATDVMDELCHKIEMERAFRKISGSWDGTNLEVTVKDMGGGEVTVLVQARKYMLADRDKAVDVFQKIMRRIKG
jgi:hypothetical protein